MYSAWQAKLLVARVVEKARLNGLAQRFFLTALKSTPSSERAEIHYRLAHAYTKTNDLQGAQVHFVEAIAKKPEIVHWLYRLALTEQKLGNQEAANQAFERIVALDPTSPRDMYTAAQSFSKLNDVPGAMAMLKKVLAYDSQNMKHHDFMISLARRTGQQSVVRLALEEAAAVGSANKRWLNQLVDIYEKNGEEQKIIDLLNDPQNESVIDEKWIFWVGRALARLGRNAEADEKFSQAVALLKDEEKGLGVGRFFEKERQFTDAIYYYERSLEDSTEPGPIYYRLGRCFEAMYEWEAAELKYLKAVSSPEPKAFWHGRLGVVLEQQGKLAEAAPAYATAAEVDAREDNLWTYRYVKVQHAAGNIGELADVISASTTSAIAALDTNDEKSRGKRRGKRRRKTLARDDQNSIFRLHEAHVAKAILLYSKNDFSAAANEFESAVFRQSSHSKNLYLAWANSLLKANRAEQAVAVYLQSRMVQSAFALEPRGMLDRRESQMRVYFSEFQEELELMDNAILYESGAGITVACNPLAICRQLLEREEYSGYRHFWAITKEESVPEYLRNDPRVYFIRRNSDLYLKVLASAKYLINNNTFAPYFSRRPEQKYLNTWHGVPLKTLGIDIKNGQMDHRNAARNLLHATHLSMPNEHTRKVLLERYDIEGLFTGLSAQVGYPRIDSVISPRPEISQNIRQRLGLGPLDRVLLYAPTWRGDLKNAVLDEERITMDLARLSETGHKVLFRGHTMVEKLLAVSELKKSLVPADIDTNDLLAVIDVLVTDYSSIFFDFIPTGKPIFYYAYDLEEYQSERGMYFELEDMPGEICTTIDELADSLTSLTGSNLGGRADYAKAREMFCANEDGHATTRTIDFFFNDQGTVAPDNSARKINALFYQGSFIPNGITSAFNNLIANIDHTRVRPVVLVLPSAVYSRPERAEAMEALRGKIQILGAIGGQLATLEERLVIDEFNRNHKFSTQAMSKIYFQAYEREFRRLFGNAEFDTTISFEGFQRHWSAVIAGAPSPRLGRSIMLHSAMKRERDTRFSQLQAVFSLYPRFDHLISVSQSACDVNREDITAETDIDASRFAAAENLLDLESVRALSRESIDDDISEWMETAEYCFVNVARLSPEKDHEKLLYALAEARKSSGSDLRLLVIGDGPTAGPLREITETLGLNSAVRFTGRLDNPHPYVKAADCFAFSSNYEGQGIAVLESLVIGTPVVSTDVVGPRSVLEGGYGALVENSVHGLAQGLARQATERPTYKAFDAEAYNEEALHKFNKIVFGL